MKDSVIHVLIRAKEMNKWVSLKHLSKHQMNHSLLMKLEDEGYLLIHRHVEEGTLMKLTMKGYHRFKK